MTAALPLTKRSALEQAVNDAVATRQRFADWPVVLRRAYFDQTQEATRRELRHLQWVGLFVTIGTILLDAIALPEMLGRSIAMRAALVIVPTLLLIAFARHLGLRVLKVGTACILVAFAAIVMHLASFADPATATRHSMGIVMVLCISIMLLPYLREELVGFAVSFSLATILAGVWPQMIDPQIVLQHIVTVILACGAVLMIAIRHHEERGRNFLYDMRDSFSQAELERNITILRELSEIDALTGLANRRSFHSVFESTFAKADRSSDSEVTVMMIDLDHFKRFNDEHGHQAGDRALRQVGRCLEAGFRDIEGIVARFGGEEFIAAFRSASLSEAEALAEDVRASVNDLKIRVRDTDSEHITASIGLASASAAARVDLGELTARADRALYRAKSDGRNRVIASERIELRVDRLAG